MIMAGRVHALGRRLDKPGMAVDLGADVRVTGGGCRYVGRGGLKLEAALDSFGISVEGLSCLDVGISTGGFADCLLQRGAARVLGVDVGRGQLHWKLRTDRRVTLVEGCNARFLDGVDVPGFEAQFVCADVSFISLVLVLPALAVFLRLRGAPAVPCVALVKPQFEVGRGDVGKGGVVRDEPARLRALQRVVACAAETGFSPGRAMPSPITGADGNVEFLLEMKFEQEQPPTRTL